jgi:transmembrane 9 superfamily protein 2/4
MVLLVLITLLLILMVGSIGGYISSRFYKSFGGENWKYNCLLTSALNPIMLTAVLFLTRNFLLLETSSAIAFPIGLTPALFIILISYGLALPLTFAGSYFGFNYQLAIEYPVRPTANIREIPKQPIYSIFPVSLVLGGIIPFASVWIIENYPYFNSGEFVITTASILICAESAIVFCYLHLMAEDHRWWWRSYLTIGFAAVYYFIHCLCYIIFTLIIDDFISALFYGLFSLILSLLLFSLIGTIGFLVCFAFIWMTYTLNKPIAEVDYSTFPEAT